MLSWLNEDFLIAALAEWIACVIISSNPPQRVTRKTGTAISCGMLVIRIVILWATNLDPLTEFRVSLPVQLLKATIYIVLMCVHIRLICRISNKTAGVLGLFAFLASELAVGFSMFGHYLVLRNGGTLTTWIRWVIIVPVFLVIFGSLYFIERYLYRKVPLYAASVQELLFTAAVTYFCYALSYAFQIFMHAQWSALWDSTMGSIPRWTYDLVGIFILYARRLWKGYLQIRHELEMIRNVIEKQKGQYEQSAMNAEVIHQQYHDLKNQIAIMRADLSTREQELWLNDLENKVEQIEPERLTGNTVLDTILWEKTQYCKLHDIRLSYVLNGDLFENIAIDDLCVLFGGALDNAIEAVMKLPDPEQRLIHIKAMEQQGYVAVCIENINHTPLTYQDDVLISSKKDKAHHGYGIKGIRYVAEKYDGSVSIVQDGCWLRLTILLKQK